MIHETNRNLARSIAAFQYLGDRRRRCGTAKKYGPGNGFAEAGDVS